MSKDRINIDDFVRKTLSAHPEQEDHSAWLRMKDLLEKEMPEKPAAFYIRWRKPMGLLSAAVLVGLLCVGGYQMNHWLKNADRQTKSVQIPAPISTVKDNNKNTPGVFSSTLANNNTTLAATTEHQSKDNTHTGDVKDISSHHSNNNTYQPAQPVNGQGAISSGTNNKKAMHTAGHAPSNPLPGKQQLKSAATGSGSDKLSIPSDSKNQSDNNLLAGNNTNKAAEKTIRQSPAAMDNAVNNTQNKLSEKPLAHNTKKSEAVSSNLAADAKTTGTSGNDLGKASQTATNDTKQGQDSIELTTVIKQSVTSKGFPKKVRAVVDTLANTKVAVQEKETGTTAAVSAKPKQMSLKKTAKATNIQQKSGTASIQSNEIVPAASIKLNKESGATTLAANSTAKQGKQDKKSFFQIFKNINIDEAIQSAKADLGRAQLYYGIAGGFNYSFNQNQSFQGVHFGPTFELAFNKHWSLFGSVRYFNRSGNKKSVDDNYIKQNAYLDSVVGANYYFQVLTDSINRHFNFSTLHSFEVPISVRYTFNNNLYIFGGMNLAYYLPVNVEEVNKVNYNTPQTVITNSTQKPILVQGSPKLTSADFGARFGIGCLAGVGYKITPSWQADARMVYNFWDNAKGTGAKAISKDFYKLPSLQLTIGYQLFRDNRKATFGPTDQK